MYSLTVATNLGQGDLGKLLSKMVILNAWNLLKIRHWEREPHMMYMGCDGL